MSKIVVADCEFATYVDDSTIYKSHEPTDLVITSLQNTAKELFKWFSNNQMNGNTDKCIDKLLLSSNEIYEIQIDDLIIKKSDCEKLLGVKIDLKLSFTEHIGDLRKKANRKLRALARTTPYITLQKRT